MSQSKLIEVDAKALHQVLCALNGPPHLVRELQATRDVKGLFSGNPIDLLIRQYDEAFMAPSKIMGKFTERQAIVVSAVTGCLCGEFSKFHEAIEKQLGRPIWTHQLADPAVAAEIKAAFMPEYEAMQP